MCVAAIAWQAHPRWQLVAIGNRDEYHERPAAPLSRWNDREGIIAGRDLRSGGTWLGISEAGRFALVTNRRGFGDPDPTLASRGSLMTDILSGTGAYADTKNTRLNEFNPFNLILADTHEARFLSNRPDETRTSLAHGIYGLSNGALDEPWPKTLQLKAALLTWLNHDSGDTANLFEDLASEEHPDVGLQPGQPSEVSDEARDTAPFIRHSIYGTRCSTIVAIDRNGLGIITERRFSPGGNVTGESHLTFSWPQSNRPGQSTQWSGTSS
ncbi:MAG: NRDE family protein [Sphingomonadaceae bacterium]|nr:NRDE family protein [Sphingomonadaceae bacterium]